MDLKSCQNAAGGKTDSLMKKGGYDMLTLYTAIGNYQLTEKGLPLVDRKSVV